MVKTCVDSDLDLVELLFYDDSATCINANVTLLEISFGEFLSNLENKGNRVILKSYQTLEVFHDRIFLNP